MQFVSHVLFCCQCRTRFPTGAEQVLSPADAGSGTSPDLVARGRPGLCCLGWSCIAPWGVGQLPAGLPVAKAPGTCEVLAFSASPGQPVLPYLPCASIPPQGTRVRLSCRCPPRQSGFATWLPGCRGELCRRSSVDGHHHEAWRCPGPCAQGQAQEQSQAGEWLGASGLWPWELRVGGCWGA